MEACLATGVSFTAPWSRSLRCTTLVSVALLAALPLVTAGTQAPMSARAAIIALPLLILAGSVPCVIRGYTLAGNRLLVRRAGWSSIVELRDLRDAHVDARAMQGSWRLFGNGGLFCFAGRFRNRRLGSYRAFATDPARSVVLTFADRKVVVTPGDPVAFVAALQVHVPGAFRRA
jgi:hypothetical protein